RRTLSGGVWVSRAHEPPLDLSRPTGKPAAGAPPAYLKPGEARLDAPPAPRDRPVEGGRAALQPEPVVLPHRLDAVAEIQTLRAERRLEQLGELRRERLPLIEQA